MYTAVLRKKTLVDIELMIFARNEINSYYIQRIHVAIK